MIWTTAKQILQIIFSIFLSWVLVHVFAVFGVFFFITYPFWVLAHPSKETSLFKILIPNKKKAEGYKICDDSKTKKRNVGMQLFANMILILLITAASIGVLYGEKVLIERIGLLTPKETAQISIPIKNEYKIGELFTMPIEVSGLEISINTVQVDIKYSPELFEIVDFLTADSFAEIFIQREIRNDLGLARFSGGLPNPGYDAESGLFGKILFLTKKSGYGEIEILPSSLVIANDKEGTNVLAEFQSSAVRVKNERISKDEEAFQKNFLSSNVLGVTSGKMEFFDEDILPLESVLGVEDESEDKSKLNFWDILHLIDSKIINVISKCIPKV
ncbi:MAG: cohesin domain-containing protein [Candidatus Dojkabacteria bacterium]|nr:cohesin domain-containing protein [Candidatus Dojkabacteria bacterium]